MRPAAVAVFVGILLVLLLLAMSVYTVDQRQAAIKFQLGEVIDVQTKPGLYFQVPLLQNVRRYDMRIQTMEARDPERFLTSENRNVLVDSFVKWRVVDVRQYYVSVRGDSLAAEARISQTVNDALRAEFAKRTVQRSLQFPAVDIRLWPAQGCELRLKLRTIRILEAVQRVLTLRKNT